MKLSDLILEKRKLYIFVCICLISIGVGVRISSIGKSYQHPDEIIPQEVVFRMLREQTLDTNWKDAELPSHFRYSQYNFSAFHVLNFYLVKVYTAFDLQFKDGLIPFIRGVSTIFGVLVIALTYLLGKRIFDTNVGWLAATLVAVNPLMYQDGLYARPETFFTFVTLLLFLVCFSFSNRPVLRDFLGSSILGIMVATKITAVLLIFIFFLRRNEPVIEGNRKEAFFQYIRHCYLCFERWPVVVLGLISGFSLFAPYAVINFQDYVSGINYLVEQYKSTHWPHGVVDGSFFERLWYVVRYFISTSGIFVYLAFVSSLFFLFKEARFRLFGCALFLFFIYLYLARQPVFFERNFSNILPLLFTFSSYAIFRVINIIRRRYELTCDAISFLGLTSICCFSLFFNSIETTYAIRFKALSGVSALQYKSLSAELSNKFETDIVSVGIRNVYDKSIIPSVCRAYLLDFEYPNDNYSISALTFFTLKYGFELVGRLNSVFDYVPASTLHTYISPTHLFYYRDANAVACRDSGELRTVRPSLLDHQLPTKLIHRDATWSESGSFGQRQGPLGQGVYFGSWSGSDAGIGTIRFSVDADHSKSLALPLLGGPVANRQFLRVFDSRTMREIVSRRALGVYSNWVFLDLPLDGSKKIEVEVSDEGDGWGEWIAVGGPYQVVERD